MMSSQDDDVEPRLKAVENYYFVDDDDSPVSFDVLPFQFNAAEEVPSFKRDVYLRGFADCGLQKVYKQVVAWKLGLEGELPEITVLSTEGSWIVLLKPRSSYKVTIRSVLITVEMLHFVRRNPMVAEEKMWGHLQEVFGKFEIRPSVDDFRNHVQLIKLFAERDQAIAKSQTLQLFLSKNTVEMMGRIAQNTVKNIVKVDQNTVEMIDKVASDDLEEEEGDLFDSVCAVCDNGGELLCCEGSCMRSFHAKIGDGEDSYCATLGYTKAELEAIKNFLCKNCEYKEHQCFVCGVLEPSDGPNAKVFLCNNATCGYFYHPKCVAQKLHPNNRNEALQLEKNIMAGFSFTCPVHWCFECKGLEDRTQEPLQFAVCRWCPRSYHRKCLPREISFEENDEVGIIIQAWELSKRILIYCLDHDMDLDIGTPSRDHLKFPHIAKPVHSVKKKVKDLAQKKRRTFDDSYFDEPVQKSSRRAVAKSSVEPVKKKAKYLKEIIGPGESLLECHVVANSPKQPVNKQEQELASLSLPTKRKTPRSSFPAVDSETEKRQLDKIIAQGKLERSVQAVQAALQKLENGGTVDDAKALSPSMCESCLSQKKALELRRTYDFLTRLRDEYESCRAQLLARHPCVSLMDALADIRNDEIRLREAGLLPSPSVLVARSSAAPPVVPSSMAPSSRSRGDSSTFQCDYCGKEGHVESYCYRKKREKKA
ncbi:hypothetical protein QOZ80_8AG0626260 [Eleusine coracana subsp. coracana]|nr:hypothetical protein QOZ80_8AG0626260 [Eleusine coracana subsp. coracana]